MTVITKCDEEPWRFMLPPPLPEKGKGVLSSQIKFKFPVLLFIVPRDGTSLQLSEMVEKASFCIEL